MDYEKLIKILFSLLNKKYVLIKEGKNTIAVDTEIKNVQYYFFN